MHAYRKEIEITDTGMIVAEIYRNETRVGLNFFSQYPWRTKERTAELAHKWADNWIEYCKKYEYFS